jgi:hypothetical protein
MLQKLLFIIFYFYKIEEALLEEKKSLEQFKKDQDSLLKKAKLADNELKKAKLELENFQVIKII